MVDAKNQRSDRTSRGDKEGRAGVSVAGNASPALGDEVPLDLVRTEGEWWE